MRFLLKLVIISKANLILASFKKAQINSTSIVSKYSWYPFVPNFTTSIIKFFCSRQSLGKRIYWKVFFSFFRLVKQNCPAICGDKNFVGIPTLIQSTFTYKKKKKKLCRNSNSPFVTNSHRYVDYCFYFFIFYLFWFIIIMIWSIKVIFCFIYLCYILIFSLYILLEFGRGR